MDWLYGHEFEQTSGVADEQGSLACCSPWGHKESDLTEWTEPNLQLYLREMRQSKKGPRRIQAPPLDPQEPFGFHCLRNGVGSFSFETLKVKVAKWRGRPKSHSSQVAGPEGGLLSLLSLILPEPQDPLPSHCTHWRAKKMHSPLAYRPLNGVQREFMGFSPRRAWLPTPVPPTCEWCHPRHVTYTLWPVALWM